MDWKPYLESVCRDSRYAISRQCYTPLDVLDRRSGVQGEPPFLLDLRLRTVAAVNSLLVALGDEDTGVACLYREQS